MEFLMEHWLSVGVGVFLLAMILYGHNRGFLRMAVSMLALVAGMVVVPAAMPYVTGFLNENTGIRQTIGKRLTDMAGGSVFFEQNAVLSPARRRELIESLKLPEQMKESLLEHNNSEIYDLLGVNAFLDYLGEYLAHMILNLFSSIILFLLIYVGIRLLIRWLDLISRLPVLHGINQIAGAALGGAQGLLFIWLLCLAVKIGSETRWAQTVLAQIEGSWWLGFLYEKNLLDWLLKIVLNGFIS